MIPVEDYDRVISLAKAQAKYLGFGKDKEGTFTFTCFRCGETIEVYVSSLNGHTHGKCKKSHCFHWIE